MGDRGCGRGLVCQRSQELLALARGAAEHSIHQAGRTGRPLWAAALHPALRELDRAVDRRVVRAFREQKLEQTQAKRGGDRRVEAPGRPSGEHGDELIRRAAPLHRPERELLGLGPLAPFERVALGGGRKRAVGPRVVLEHPPQYLESGAARRSRREAQCSRRGDGLPRR